MSRTAKSLLAEDIENLALNPRVQHFASLRPTSDQRQGKAHWKRGIHRPGHRRQGDFKLVKTIFTPKGAVFEAQRCLKCADAPCQKGCPTSIDIKMFIQCIATQNYYGAAKIILSDNPVGLSCGLVCPTETLCVGGCNLAGDAQGPIDIGALQAFAVDTFRKMRVKQIRDPALPPPDAMPSAYHEKIAIVGCGPAGISCGTFLARLGYTNITVMEQRTYGGGLSTAEIPNYRLEDDQALWEVRLLTDLGVPIRYGCTLGHDFTVDSLRKDGYAAIFLSVGLPEAKSLDIFEGLGPEQGFYTSKDFLPLVAEGTKSSLCCQSARQAPRLFGKVLVLGAGDTAFDCAGSAFRCGAKRVIVTFRRSFPDMRAVDEEFLAAREEDTEFLPYFQPQRVIVEGGRIQKLVLAKMECDEHGRYTIDDEQTITVRCDFVISAFGSKVADGLQKAMHPMTFRQGVAAVNPQTMASEAAPWLFGGGDLVGSALTVEAANDGKTAAWSIHALLQGQPSLLQAPRLPMFCTEIDAVDVSVTFCGIRFPNPFGIASATGATSSAMIARAFDAGWGFAVTKTFVLDKDYVVNVSPRIVRGTTSGPHFGPHQSSFLNIELISEKTAAYWLSTIRQLKRDYPTHVVIASIMCGYDRDDWRELTRLAQEAGPDALELNLSCPHGMGERGMGLACGQKVHMVRDICSWVSEVATVPFFAKMTPNVTDITEIARAAKEGGATGVTAINTVSGLMGLASDGSPWPAVGSAKATTYGGVSGNAVRPIALRAVSSIANALPGYPLMATGGADSAHSVVEFLRCGASVVQICSAVQNQDFTVVADYIMGLKAHLYMSARPDLCGWDRQEPPRTAPTLVTGSIPKFGDGIVKRWTIDTDDLVDVDEAPIEPPARVPTVADIIGSALPAISNYNNLDNTQQVVAVVNDDLCINCGKCYMTCNDSGYQAIRFDPVTHQPYITDLCTGCTLCLSVCPIPDCISMVPKSIPHTVSRGIPLGEPQLPTS